MMPEKFSLPWIEIDPELKHGGVDGELAPYFVGPELGDNSASLNQDMITIFAAVNKVGMSISMAPEAMSEAQPGRRVIEEALMGINDIFEKIIDVTHTDASKFFEWNHASPPRDDFGLQPLRYPLRNRLIHTFVHACIGLLIEVAELNRNGLHAGLDPQGANKLIAPLYKWKATVMKNLFDLEVQGEISMAEMIILFNGRYRPGPIVSPPDETAEMPSQAEVEAALNGQDVMQWFPSDVNWATFGNLNMLRYIPERTLQPEGTLPTTEDVAPENAVGSDGASIIGNNAGQP